MVLRVVSGGQTGVDRAALDVARELGLPCGGWCPAGRWAEGGPIPLGYPLRETPSADPAQRTAWNVRDSDATLVLSRSGPKRGTALTLELAARLCRPHLLLSPGGSSVGAARAWLRRHRIGVLNVAGPRESEDPGVYAAAYRFLHILLQPRTA